MAAPVKRYSMISCELIFKHLSMKHAKQYFENHGTVNKLYFTSDNLAFFDEQNAINHASHLDDQTITSKTREEVDKEVEEIANDNWQDGLEYDPLDEPDAE
jgi:hypothetical protein